MNARVDYFYEQFDTDTWPAHGIALGFVLKNDKLIATKFGIARREFQKDKAYAESREGFHRWLTKKEVDHINQILIEFLMRGL